MCLKTFWQSLSCRSLLVCDFPVNCYGVIFNFFKKSAVFPQADISQAVWLWWRMPPTCWWTFWVSSSACCPSGSPPDLQHTGLTMAGTGQVQSKYAADLLCCNNGNLFHFYKLIRWFPTSCQYFNPRAPVLFSRLILRSEILGALVSVLTIWLVTGVLVYLAVERLISNDYTIEGTVMLITSGCAVLANIMWV